jgi:hypothetical protein
MKIYIGFSKPTIFFPIFGWVIQAVESRPYDHVYIRIQEPMDNEYMIFQASKSMVNLYSSKIFLSVNKPIKEYEIDINPDQYVLLWRFIKANLGIPYSLKEDFGILLMKIFHIAQPFNGGFSVEFCSKLGANVCNLLGISMLEDVGSIDPSGLDTILNNKLLMCTENPTWQM